MRLPRMAGLAVVLFALSAAPVFARCDPATEPDRADIANARDAVLANCDCAGAKSHGAYVRCAVDRIAAVLVNRQCRRKAKECAAKSTCGRPGAVTCCKEKRGRTKCKVAHSAAACEAKGGTAGSCSSCCDACPEPGWGPSCPVSSTTTTSTTPSTTLDTTTITVTTTTVTTEPAGFYCCVRSVQCGAFDTCEEMTFHECLAADGFPGGPGGCDVPAPCEHANTTTPPSACCVGEQCIYAYFCECVNIHHGTFLLLQRCDPDPCATTTTTTLPMTLVPDRPSLR